MSDLFARQVAQFPSEPGDAGKQVLDASIELLNADGLEDLLRRTDISFLGDHGKQSLSEYVAYVRRLEELRGGLRGVESAEAMRSVRHELARLGFCNLIRQLRLAVGPADTALARAGGLDFQDQRLQDSPEEVRAYLDCRDRFLARDYLAAAEELRRFQERFPESRLVPVAIQLQAQALVAGGRWEEGMKLFAGLGQVNCPPPARMVSTVGARGAFPERPLFALLATLGLGRMPEPGEVLFSPGLSADPDRQMVFRMFYLTSPQDGSGPQPRVVEVEIQVPVQAGSTLR
jgi:hypothetical protein